MLGEFVQDDLHFFEKPIRHLLREAVPDEYALNDKVFTVGRHGVSRNQPAAIAQPISQFVEGEV